MQCRYARMAIFRETQQDWVGEMQGREDYIRAALGENFEFKHSRTILYYSPRLIADDLIAGVIEKRTKQKLKTGPWVNQVKEAETFQTANFAFRLTGGQEVTLEQESSVYTGDAIKVLKSLGTHINNQGYGWLIDFRVRGTQRDLDEYLQKHSGHIKRISITLEKPNADFGQFKDLHDDLKESLSRIRASRLKKEYQSDGEDLKPDEEVQREMNWANDGNGDLKIAKKDDPGKSSSFNSKENELTANVDESRKIDEVENDNEKRDIAESMLGGVGNEDSKDNNQR